MQSATPLPMIDLGIGTPMMASAALEEALRVHPGGLNLYHDTRPELSSDLARSVFAAHDPRLHMLPGNLSVLATEGGRAGFDIFMRSVARAVTVFQRRTGQVLQPSVILPVPTFGELVQNITGNGCDVLPHPLREEDGWKLMPRALGQTLEDAQKDTHALVVALVEISPHNPTGAVSTYADVAARYWEIQKHNLGRRKKLAALAGQEKFDRLMQEPVFAAAVHVLSRLKIFEDMVYFGSETGARATASYHELFLRYPGVSNDVFSAFSVSKFAGAAEPRAGLAITGPSFAVWMQPVRPLASIALNFNAHRPLAACFDPEDPVFSGVQDYVHARNRRFAVCRAIVEDLAGGEQGRAMGVRVVPGDSSGMFRMLEFLPELWEPRLKRFNPDLAFPKALPSFLKEKLGLVLTPAATMLMPAPGENIMRIKCDAAPEMIAEAMDRIRYADAIAFPLLPRARSVQKRAMKAEL